MAFKDPQHLSVHKTGVRRKSKRRQQGVGYSRPLVCETLEARQMLTLTVFLDFGSGFGTNGITSAWSSVNGPPISNVTLTQSAAALQQTGTVLTALTKIFAPFDVTFQQYSATNFTATSGSVSSQLFTGLRTGLTTDTRPTAGGADPRTNAFNANYNPFNTYLYVIVAKATTGTPTFSTPPNVEVPTNSIAPTLNALGLTYTSNNFSASQSNLLIGNFSTTFTRSTGIVFTDTAFSAYGASGSYGNALAYAISATVGAMTGLFGTGGNGSDIMAYPGALPTNTPFVSRTYNIFASSNSPVTTRLNGIVGNWGTNYDQLLETVGGTNSIVQQGNLYSPTAATFVTGTGGNDTVTLGLSGANSFLTVTVNTFSYDIPFVTTAQRTPVTILGGGGSDTFNIAPNLGNGPQGISSGVIVKVFAGPTYAAGVRVKTLNVNLTALTNTLGVPNGFATYDPNPSNNGYGSNLPGYVVNNEAGLTPALQTLLYSSTITTYSGTYVDPNGNTLAGATGTPPTPNTTIFFNDLPSAATLGDGRINISGFGAGNPFVLGPSAAVSAQYGTPTVTPRNVATGYFLPVNVTGTTQFVVQSGQSGSTFFDTPGGFTNYFAFLGAGAAAVLTTTPAVTTRVTSIGAGTRTSDINGNNASGGILEVQFNGNYAPDSITGAAANTGGVINGTGGTGNITNLTIFGNVFLRLSGLNGTGGANTYTLDRWTGTGEAIGNSTTTIVNYTLSTTNAVATNGNGNITIGPDPVSQTRYVSTQNSQGQGVSSSLNLAFGLTGISQTNLNILGTDPGGAQDNYAYNYFRNSGYNRTVVVAGPALVAGTVARANQPWVIQQLLVGGITQALTTVAGAIPAGTTVGVVASGGTLAFAENRVRGLRIRGADFIPSRNNSATLGNNTFDISNFANTTLLPIIQGGAGTNNSLTTTLTAAIPGVTFDLAQGLSPALQLPSPAPNTFFQSPQPSTNQYFVSTTNAAGTIASGTVLASDDASPNAPGATGADAKLIGRAVGLATATAGAQNFFRVRAWNGFTVLDANRGSSSFNYGYEPGVVAGIHGSTGLNRVLGLGFAFNAGAGSALNVNDSTYTAATDYDFYSNVAYSPSQPAGQLPPPTSLPGGLPANLGTAPKYVWSSFPGVDPSKVTPNKMTVPAAIYPDNQNTTLTKRTYAGVSFDTSVTTANIYGSTGANRFYGTPSKTTSVNLNPQIADNTPGGIDRLSLSFFAGQTIIAGPSGFTPAGGSGQWNFTAASGYKPVHFAGMIDINSTSTVYVAPGGADFSTVSQPIVQAYDPISGRLQSQFYAYEPTFTGGVKVAQLKYLDPTIPGNTTVYLNYVVTAPGRGRVGEVRIWQQLPDLNGQLGTPRLLASFQPYGSGFTGGLNIAIGSVTNNGGIPDIVVSPALGAAPVRIYRLTANADGSFGSTLWNSFLAYPASYIGGVQIAVAKANPADVNASVVTAPQGGTTATIRIWSGALLAAQQAVGVVGNATPGLTGQFNFLPAAAGGISYRGGVSLAASDTDKDGVSKIYIGAGTLGNSLVQVFGFNSQILRDSLGRPLQFNAYTDASANVAALRITVKDVLGDGTMQILTAQGPNGRSNGFNVFRINGTPQGSVNFKSYNNNATPNYLQGGVNLG